jgi:Fe-S oxidoreductase
VARLIDTTRFDPKGFYGGMAGSKSLLINRDALKWAERFTAPERPVDALLAFGCAVQHTPHLMLEATRVFEALGIDYAAVTGRQFCCGRPFQRMGGDQEAADRISSKTYERFVAYQPQVAVQWCGACMLQYLEVISGQAQPPFDVIHVTKYLADLLRERGDDVPWKQEVRARVVLHTHGQFLPQQDVDTSSILQILDMIPGVEYAGRIEPPSAGSPCDGTGPTAVGIFNTLSTEEYHAARGELEEQAAAAGADTLVTPYHKCQLEWSKLSSRTMAVREWMSLLAEALGVGAEDRFTEYWHLGDPEAIVRRARPQWESWGLTEAEAIEAARRSFVPEYVVDVHHCDCGGRGCGSPFAELRSTVGADER